MTKKTMAKSVVMLVFLIAVSQGNVFAGWTAYNDFSTKFGTANPANTTEFAGGETGDLLDFATGNDTGVDLAITAVGDGGVENTGYPDAGTEAFNEFDGAVVLDGYFYGSGSGFTLTLSGLDPTKAYTAVLFGNRGNYDDRYTYVTLGGADRFTNSSTVGALISGSNDETTRITTGDQRTTGQVFRYSDIASGSDGIITFTIPAGERNYLNAFKLTELTETISEPATLGYEVWTAQYPTLGALTNYVDDIDEDGMDNLLEYALGGNPTLSDAVAILPVSEVDGDWLDYVYNRRTNAAIRGLDYILESTDDPAVGTWTNGSFPIMGVENMGNGFESVTNRIALAMDMEIYLRLAVAMDGSRAYSETIEFVSEFNLWTEGYGLLGADAELDADPDSDGLTNEAEYKANTDPTNANTDGDGFTDAEEEFVGTDPGDPNSFFALSLDGTTFNWPHASGRLYNIEGCSNLVEGNWFPITNTALDHYDHNTTNNAYFYRVTASVDSADSFAFALMADPRDDELPYVRTLQEVVLRAPEALLITGDIDPASSEPVDARIANFYDVFGADTETLLIPSIGNHDMEDGMIHRDQLMAHVSTNLPGAVMRDGVAGDYYLDYKNVRFITVDPYSVLGSGGVINATGLAYVEAAIVSAPTNIQHIFVSIHEPAFPRNDHLTDSFNADPILRNNFWNMLMAHKDRVKALFVGHTHVYSRIRVLDPTSAAANDPNQFPDDPGGIYQIDSGAAGHDWRWHNCIFVMVEITGDQIECVTYRAADDAVQPFSEIDRWTID